MDKYMSRINSMYDTLRKLKAYKGYLCGCDVDNDPRLYIASSGVIDYGANPNPSEVDTEGLDLFREQIHPDIVGLLIEFYEKEWKDAVAELAEAVTRGEE